MEEASETTISRRDVVIITPEHLAELEVIADAVQEYAGCLSCWIEEDDLPTAQQLVDGLARAALLWGGTPPGCKGSLRFYAGQMRRYKKLLLERLDVAPSE